MGSLIFLAAACLALTAVVAKEKPRGGKDIKGKIIVCYSGGWAHRPGSEQFPIEHIDSSHCSYLIYASVSSSVNEFQIFNGWQDLPDTSRMNYFTALRRKNSTTKTLVAIGGGNKGSQKYSGMASYACSRTEFIKNIVAFVKKHNFNGVSLNWEYLVQGVEAVTDVQNFVALIKEMKEAFYEEHPQLLLTAAVGAAKSSACRSYNISEIFKYLDFINLMSWDLHGSSERQTFIHAPLYPGASETGPSREWTVDATVNYWLSQGAYREQLILGVHTYGITFTLANLSDTSIGPPTSGPGSGGIYGPGIYGYNEILDLQKSRQWTMVFDSVRRSFYAYFDNQWVSCDNVQFMKERIQYAIKMRLGGVMISSIETDVSQGKYNQSDSLIKTAYQVIRNSREVSERPSQPPKPTEPSITVNPTQPSVTQKPKPTMPDNNMKHNIKINNRGGFCTEERNIVHPDGCSKFIMCSSARTKGKITETIVHCPLHFCFNPKCNKCE